MSAVNGFVRLKITGLNQDRLISTYNRENVSLFKVVKPSRKIMFLTVKNEEIKKIFAITPKLCYNISVIKRFGLDACVCLILRNACIILGFLLLTAVEFLSSSAIFEIDYEGSGSAYVNRLEEYFSSVGLKKYTFFSSYDLKSVETRALADNDWLSFISLKKRGGRLVVTSYLSADGTGRVDDTVKELRSGFDGVVTEIKAYRGTATVSVGDKVKKNDLLVAGYVSVRDLITPVNVYAFVRIRTEKTVDVFLRGDGRESEAVALVLGEIGDENAEYSVKKTTEKDGFVYSVKVSYTVTEKAG
ncbi:MAG: sporulation protein YqfD [Clostridia bacterium]|nr:sporulation protein YqfD [Clostridia bacterium]